MMETFNSPLLKSTLRSGLLLALLSGVAACGTGATYGTGSTSEQKLLESAVNILGVEGDEKEPIDYRQRAPLVVPGKSAGLVKPESDATSDATNWPQDPDVIAYERRKKQRKDEKLALLNDPDGKDNRSSIQEITTLRKAGARGTGYERENKRSHSGSDDRAPLLTNTELQNGHKRPDSEVFGTSNSYDNRSDDEKRAALKGDSSPVLNQNDLAGKNDLTDGAGNVAYSENSFDTRKRRYLIEPPTKYRKPARTESGTIVAPATPVEEKKSGLSKLWPF